MTPGRATGWIATFRDGPLAGHDHDRTFVVGDPWEQIVLAPVPATEARGEHYVVVGGDGMPPIDEPWSGQVTYRLVFVTPVDSIGERAAEYEVA